MGRWAVGAGGVRRVIVLVVRGGLCAGSAAVIVNVFSRLSLWMLAVGAMVDDIDEELLARFVAHERSREVGCSGAMRAVGTMRGFLRACIRRRPRAAGRRRLRAP
ncbi:MAG: hypothetical protein NVS3B26_18230 [Mycobacteriales bacterium]